MDLLLWRHGETLDGAPEAERLLSERGRTQAARVASWLRMNGPRELRVLSAPSARSRQTAAALGRGFETVKRLGTGACVSDVLAATGWPDGGTAVLVVGHQPVLGRMAALLLSGHEADWTIKKGALWWFSNRVRQDETQTVLRAVVAPDVLRSHALLADLEGLAVV